MAKAQIKVLLFDKASIVVLVKYFFYSNIFLVENITKVLKYFKINDYIIELKKDKQSSFSSIYSLGSVELEILKAYNKANMANNFISLLTSL